MRAARSRGSDEEPPFKSTHVPTVEAGELSKLQRFGETIPSPIKLPCCGIIDLRADPRLLAALIASQSYPLVARICPGGNGPICSDSLPRPFVRMVSKRWFRFVQKSNLPKIQLFSQYLHGT